MSTCCKTSKFLEHMRMMSETPFDHIKVQKGGQKSKQDADNPEPETKMTLQDYSRYINYNREYTGGGRTNIVGINMDDAILSSDDDDHYVYPRRTDGGGHYTPPSENFTHATQDVHDYSASYHTTDAELFADQELAEFQELHLDYYASDTEKQYNTDDEFMATADGNIED